MAIGLLIAIIAWEPTLWWEARLFHEAAESRPHAGSPLMPFWFMALAAIGTVMAAIALRSVNLKSPFAGKRADQLSASALAKAGARLDHEASKIAALAASSADSHESYAESLSAMQDRISTVKTPDQLRAIATLLAAENHRMRLETHGMARKLEASRTQLEALHVSLEEAQEQGLRDSLTKVGNRRALDKELEDAVKRAEANAEPLSVVMVDIDRFKSINDKYGHQAGDAVLQSFAEILARFARDRDTVARFGGEEFAIVLPATPSLAASILAERLRSQIEGDSFKIPAAGRLRITASLGVAELRDGETASDLVNRADKLLYQAKTLGRNRVATV
jgi:diguanylate cyclase